jgi:Flp pilus assembly protein TadD
MSGKSRREQIEAMLQDDSDEDGFLRYCLAMEHRSEGNNEGAVATFRELLRVKPDYVPGYMQLGQLLNQLGDEEEAKKVDREGIAVAQKKGDTHAAGEMGGFLALLE